MILIFQEQDNSFDRKNITTMFDAIDKVESLTGLYLQVKTEREVLIFFLTISGQAKSFRAHASGII